MDNVKLFRIDYRLLHWQTGVLWVQKLKANMILVAGDKVAADDMRRNLIKLAAPKSVKTRIVPIAEAAAFLNSENVKKMLDMGVEIGCYTVPTEKSVNITKYL